VWRKVFVAVAVLVLSVSEDAWCQNPLFNPDFDTDISGWACQGIGTVVWSPADVNASSGSGSMQIDNAATNPTGNSKIFCTQCVPLGTDLRVRLFAAASFADDTGFFLAGSARVQIMFSDDAGCLNAVDFSGVGILSTPPTPADQWWSVSTGWTEVPPTATHAQATLVSWANVYAEPLRLYFDAVVLDVGVTIFADDFESSDLTKWFDAYP
jgi:hypothetical protein